MIGSMLRSFVQDIVNGKFARHSSLRRSHGSLTGGGLVLLVMFIIIITVQGPHSGGGIIQSTHIIILLHVHLFVGLLSLWHSRTKNILFGSIHTQNIIQGMTTQHATDRGSGTWGLVDSGGRRKGFLGDLSFGSTKNIIHTGISFLQDIINREASNQSWFECIILVLLQGRRRTGQFAISGIIRATSLRWTKITISFARGYDTIIQYFIQGGFAIQGSV
mmetsp:Transcript_8970/g.18615  ORF Transcript_8970/g.18615 Transcript_8970/m.18615 type:complete len:219 (-) Transcript_8970:878-1534(-)